MQSHVTTQATGSYAMKKYLKNAQILKFTRTLLILTSITMVGILINILANKALDFNQET
jgi:hypothetical protein